MHLKVQNCSCGVYTHLQNIGECAKYDGHDEFFYSARLLTSRHQEGKSPLALGVFEISVL